jgi:hypothetical protein
MKGISDTQKRSKDAVFGHFSLSKFLDRRCLAYCLIQFFSVEIFSRALRKVEGESQVSHQSHINQDSRLKVMQRSENFWAVRICSTYR